MLLAPSAQVHLANCFQGFANASLRNLHDRRRHPEQHLCEAAPTVLSLHAFPLADQRFEHFATGRETFPRLQARALLGQEFHQRLGHPLARGRACDRGQLLPQFLGRLRVIAFHTRVLEHAILHGR